MRYRRPRIISQRELAKWQRLIDVKNDQEERETIPKGGQEAMPKPVTFDPSFKLGKLRGFPVKWDRRPLWEQEDEKEEAPKSRKKANKTKKK